MKGQDSKDKVIIDKLVDWRRTNRPQDTAPLKVNMTPKAMLFALRLPIPAGDERLFPKTCLYRGFKIEATKAVEPPPRRELPPERPPAYTPYAED